jgi:hypothetical protein
VLPAEAELMSADREDVDVVSAVVVWIAFLTASMGRGDHGTKDVDHG